MAKLLPSSFDDVEGLRPFASIRLIAADLDGTLLPSPLAEKIQHGIRSLSSYGVRFTLATGRTFCGVRELSERLGLPRETPLVLYNGSVVREVETGQLLRRCTLPFEALRDVVKCAAAYPCEVFAYFCHYPMEVCSSEQLPEEKVTGWHFGPSVEPRADREFNGCAISWQNGLMTTAYAPAAVLLKTAKPEMLVSLAADLGRISNISVTRSGSVYLEIRPLGSNKAVGLACVAAHLGLEREEVLALGDNDNDAEMLAWAGIGVAVAEASALAQSSADYVCHRSAFKGAVELLHIIRQAQRFFGRHQRKGVVAT